MKELKLYKYLIMAIILSAPIAYYDYQYMNPADNWKWCIRNMPMKNFSDTRAKYCYTEYWAEYCKHSYPDFCPDVLASLATFPLQIPDHLFIGPINPITANLTFNISNSTVEQYLNLTNTTNTT